MALTEKFDDIQALLKQGRAEAAYSRLLTLQARHEGELEYDLLLAQSALLTERANVALFVLERILILRPRHYQARLLMANAYARLGRPQLAANELTFILAAADAHPQLKQQARAMQAQLDASASSSRWNAYIAMGFGYDSNANASTSEQTFLGFDLSPESIATPSMSELVNLGMIWQQRLASKSLLFARLDWRTNLFPQASYVNNNVVRYELGWQRPRRYALLLQSSGVDVNGAYNNAGNHLFGHYQFGEHGSGVFLRLGEQHYETMQSIKDVNQYLLGGQFALPDWGKETYLVTLLGEDLAVQSTSPYGRGLIGLNLKTIVRTLNPFTVSIVGGVLYSDYRGTFFGLGRQDTQSSLSVGFHTWRWKYWELGLDFAYSDTLSTIALYDYDRFTIGLTFKRNFVR